MNLEHEIGIAQIKVSKFNNSSLLIKNPNNKKNNALIKKAISVVNSLNLRTSWFKTVISNFSVPFIFNFTNSYKFLKNKPNNNMKIREGKWYNFEIAYIKIII